MASIPYMTGVAFGDHASGRRLGLVCVACASHKRPRDVPWSQHAIGCRLRTPPIYATLPASKHIERPQRGIG
jgi:hypothetical protein